MSNKFSSKEIFVTEIQREDLPVEIIPGEEPAPRIRIDGTEYPCKQGEEYPRTVTKISLRADGRRYIVYSHPIPCDRDDPTVFNTTVAIDAWGVNERRVMTFQEINSLREGDRILISGTAPEATSEHGVYEWQSDLSVSDGMHQLPAYYHRSYQFELRTYRKALGQQLIIPSDWLVFLAAHIGRTRGEIIREGTPGLVRRVKTLREEASRTPFMRRSDGSVSNGWMYFPLIRPNAREWLFAELHHVRFASKIAEKDWDRFLEVMIGMTFEGIRNIETVRKMIRGEQKHEPRVIPPGDCIDATFFDSGFGSMTFGDRFVFSGRVRDTEIYCVDNPKYGVGLYLFRNQQTAIDWAQGRLSPKDARRIGIFIPHTDGWRERVRQHILSLAS